MRSGSDVPNSSVAEIQGLYGAFTFPEKLLQKIWLRGDFDRSTARTTDGRSVRVLHPGKWNLLGGPDFQGARLRWGDGTEVIGDIEVHLHAGDWEAHGHACDRAYDRVILHVVLFPPDDGRKTAGAGGRDIPVLTLLPLLHHALEEFAAEEVVETLANRAFARLPDELGALSPPDLAAVLHRHADARWRQRAHFARLRVQRLGWQAACHHAALEVLGFRFNRAAMLRIAGRWPLAEWGNGGIGADAAYAAEADGWSLQGVRPANHPRTRLRQYAAWTQARPDWPAALLEFASALPPIEAAMATKDIRRTHRFAGLRARAAEQICAGTLGGSRFDSLIGDGLLPLVAAHTGREFQAIWYHWFAGDLPPMLITGLRGLGVWDGRRHPACHGTAQGLIGWLIERETQN